MIEEQQFRSNLFTGTLRKSEMPRDSLVLVCYSVGFQTCVVPVCADWHLRWAVAVCDRGISITFGL